jgi:simple sugar transport system ATP-binding protein
MRGISKRFGGVRALSDVSFSIRAAEIHCLAGENGCGKSTLIKILSGVYAPDEGQMILEGKAHSHLSPAASQRFSRPSPEVSYPPVTWSACWRTTR